MKIILNLTADGNNSSSSTIKPSKKRCLVTQRTSGSSLSSSRTRAGVRTWQRRWTCSYLRMKLRTETSSSGSLTSRMKTPRSFLRTMSAASCSYWRQLFLYMAAIERHQSNILAITRSLTLRLRSATTVRRMGSHWSHLRSSSKLHRKRRSRRKKQREMKSSRRRTPASWRCLQDRWGKSLISTPHKRRWFSTQMRDNSVAMDTPLRLPPTNNLRGHT